MKIAVLTETDAAAGYRLAGLEVAVAQNSDEAREVLARLVTSGDYALIVVNQALLPDPYQAVRREMRGRDLPVLLPGPPPREILAGTGKDARSYLQRLVRDTMGYEIKL